MSILKLTNLPFGRAEDLWEGAPGQGADLASEVADCVAGSHLDPLDDDGAFQDLGDDSNQAAGAALLDQVASPLVEGLSAVPVLEAVLEMAEETKPRTKLKRNKNKQKKTFFK